MPIPSPDYSFVGTGNLLIREYGAAAPFEPVGNCSAVSLQPQENVIELPDYTVPGGGKRSEIRRVQSVNLSFTFHDFSPENFARGMRSGVTPVTAGTATEEAVVAYKGGYAMLANIATAITTVIPAGGGAAFTPGTDYELRDGVLFIPAGSAITTPVAGAANIEVTYTYGAQKRVEALVASNKQYELLFVGLNEARQGKRTRLLMRKVSNSVIQELQLIGEEYGAGTINGALLADTSIQEQDISRFVSIVVED